ncbi:MAG: hypothetical protein Tsb0034_00720 [Ekhidna sp.]
MRKRLIILLHLIFIIRAGNSQQNLIDSLSKQLDNYEAYDESYVDLLNEVSFQYLQASPERAVYFINLAISVSKELKYEKGLIRATANKGSSYWVLGLQDEALSYYLRALTYNAENYPLEYIRLNNNIAEVFKKKDLFDSAQKYYDKALAMAEAKLNDRKPVLLITNLAETYFMLGELDSADFFYQRGLRNAIEQNNKRGLAYSYSGLGEIAFRRLDFQRALELQNTALSLRREINDVRGIIQSLHSLGIYHLHTTSYDSALVKWNEAEQLAINYKALDLLNDVYYTKYQHFYRLEEYKQAADYIKEYQSLKDSIQTFEFVTSLNRIKGALLSEISKAENQLLRQQQIKERAENRARIGFIFGGFLATFIIVYLIYQKREKRKRKFISEREELFTSSLLELSKEVHLRQPEFEKFIHDFLIMAGQNLQCERSSYWIYDPQKDEMVCYKLLVNNEFVDPPQTLPRSEYPVFFKGLMSNRTIAIDNISQSDYTDLSSHFIQETGIKSLLYASLFLDDQIVGFISFSSTSKHRNWDYSEQRYVGSLADILISAQAYNQSRIYEREKEALIEKLRVRNQSLREFNSIISHNFREPLSQVIGFADLLKTTESKGNKETTKIINKIAEAGQRMDHAIKDLSTVLNEKDPRTEDYRNILISKVLKEVFELLPGEVKKYNPEVVQELQVDEIFTYKPFLFDVLYHLIANAFSFSEPSRRLTINIQSWENDHQNVISLRDNGRGMSMHTIGNKIFKMYQRFHLDVEGRGIGLYLVKNRVNSLGGTIEVKSELNVGTTFTIHLPKEPRKLS